LKELGYDAEFYIWSGFFAPRATPPAAIKILREAIRQDFRAVIQMLIDNDWNIRDENGEVLKSPWLCQYFASGNQVQHSPTDYRTHWKLLACEGGRRALFAVWNWPLSEEDDRDELQHRVMVNNVFQDLERRSRFGVLGNRDLV
jgi:hypothetical protein